MSGANPGRAEEAARAGLTRVGGRPPLGAYLQNVWQRREFIYALARFRTQAENQQTRLGMGWVILKPLLNAGIYGLIFGWIMGAGRPTHFLEFLIIGVFMFEFFSTSFTNGAKSITANAALVQSLDFPRMALPLAMILQRLLQFIPMLVIAVAIVLVAGFPARWTWLGLLPLTAIFFVFNTGLALITARLTVHFRDLNNLLPFISRLIFYSSGVFFSYEERFAGNPHVLNLVAIVPMHEFMSLARGILLGGAANPIMPVWWLYSVVWALSLLVIGTVFFWSAEERYGRPE